MPEEARSSRPDRSATSSTGGSLDVSEKPDVDRLQSGALGLPGIMLLSLASAAPMVGALGNIPLALAAPEAGA